MLTLKNAPVYPIKDYRRHNLTHVDSQQLYKQKWIFHTEIPPPPEISWKVEPAIIMSGCNDGLEEEM